MKKLKHFIRSTRKQINKLSDQAFLPKYLPITIGVTVLLLGFYGIIFFQWMNGFSDPMKGKGATLEIQPTSSPNAEQQELVFTTQVDNIQQRNITGIQLVATVKGIVPENLEFIPAEIEGLEPLMATVSSEGDDTVIKLVFLTVPENTYTVHSSMITLGTLKFSRPDQGKVKLEFDPHLTKMIEHKTYKNVLATPQPITYTY